MSYLCYSRLTPKSKRRSAQQHRREFDAKRVPLRLADIITTERLMKAWHCLRQSGGHGPGPDGLHYDDLMRREVNAVLAMVAEKINHGNYHPHASRLVRIPKKGGEHRELYLSSVVDRAVGKLLDLSLTPWLDRLFIDQSHGGRCGRSHWTLFADLEVVMQQQDHWVLAIDDVRAAMDSTSREIVRDAYQRGLDDTRELARRDIDSDAKRPALGLNWSDQEWEGHREELIQFVLTVTCHSEQRPDGIIQGCPHSMTAFNMVMHYLHDHWFSTESADDAAWFRYVDNLVYVVPGISEGRVILDRVQDRLKSAQLTLKGKDGVWDLNAGTTVPLMGITLQKDGDGLRLAAGEEAWESLSHALQQAREEDIPAQAARNHATAWVNAFGPVLEGDSPLFAVLERMSSLGYWELPDIHDLRRTQRNARENWERLRREARTKYL